MENDILATKEFTHYGFKITYDLIASYGMGCFFSKWKEVKESASDTITDDNCTHWTCNYYTIGENISKESALLAFYRDNEAFDVDLKVTISKCDIVLYESYIVGADYAYLDGEASDLLYDLIDDYSNQDEYMDEANKKLLSLVEGLG